MRLLIICLILGGLFQYDGVKIRHLALFGIFLYLIPLIFSHIFKNKNFDKFSFLFLVFLILSIIMSYFSLNELKDFNRFLQYAFLYFSGYFLYFIFTSTDFLLRYNLRKIVTTISLLIIFFTIISILIKLGNENSILISFLANFFDPNPSNFARITNGLLNSNRFTFPFAHPAQLGLVAISSYLTLDTFKQTMFIRITAILLLLITFLTFANAIIIPTLIIFFYYGLTKIYNKNFIFLLFLIFFIILLTILFLLLNDIDLWGRDSEVISKSINRHIDLRKQSFNLIFDFSLLEMIKGVGIGQSPYYISGSYSFTVLLTQFLEGGLVLFSLQIVFFISLLRFCKSRNSFLVWWMLFLTSFLYQINNDISFYIYPLICILAIDQDFYLNNKFQKHKLEGFNHKINPKFFKNHE